MTPPPSNGPVLLFDGECGLCQRLVRRLLQLDRAGQLRFAPLQGPAAQGYLRAHGLPTEEFNTLVFIPDWPQGTAPPCMRTAGVIAALRAAGRPGLAGGLAIVPRGLRDAGYKFVARVRRRIFGPWRPEAGPRPEWAGRFLE